jgi:hypothetical protein
MKTPLEKYYFKKEEIRKYWDKIVARYEPYLNYPANGYSWVSFSFKYPWYTHNKSHSLVMVSLYHDKILLTAVHWRGEKEEEKTEEKRIIDSYYDYISAIHYIDSIRNFFN